MPRGPAGVEQSEDRQAAEGGDDHQGQRPAGEPVEQGRIRVVQLDEGGQRQRPATMAAAWARRAK